MCAYKSNKAKAVIKIELGDKTISVSLNIEYHAFAIDYAGVRIVHF